MTNFKTYPIGSLLATYRSRSENNYNPCKDKSGFRNPLERLIRCQSYLASIFAKFQVQRQLSRNEKFIRQIMSSKNTPRCGVKDGPLLYSLQNRWNKKVFKWKLIQINLPSFGATKTRALLRESFNDWAKYAPLTFREVSQNEKADFEIAFIHRYHDDIRRFDGPGGTLAYAYFPPSGIIRFEAEEPWTDKYDKYGFNLRIVATHEIGHALGLQHSNQKSSIMYEHYQLIKPNHLLPKDDQDGIQVLYGRRFPAIRTTSATTRKTATTTRISRKITTRKILVSTKKTTMKKIFIKTTQKPSITTKIHTTKRTSKISATTRKTTTTTRVTTRRILIKTQIPATKITTKTTRLIKGVTSRTSITTRAISTKTNTPNSGTKKPTMTTKTGSSTSKIPTTTRRTSSKITMTTTKKISSITAVISKIPLTTRTTTRTVTPNKITTAKTITTNKTSSTTTTSKIITTTKGTTNRTLSRTEVTKTVPGNNTRTVTLNRTLFAITRKATIISTTTRRYPTNITTVVSSIKPFTTRVTSTASRHITTKLMATNKTTITTVTPMKTITNRILIDANKTSELATTPNKVSITTIAKATTTSPTKKITTKETTTNTQTLKTTMAATVITSQRSYVTAASRAINVTTLLTTKIRTAALPVITVGTSKITSLATQRTTPVMKSISSTIIITTTTTSNKAGNITPTMFSTITTIFTFSTNNTAKRNVTTTTTTKPKMT